MRRLVGMMVLGFAVTGACSGGERAEVPTPTDLQHHVFEGSDIEGEGLPDGLEQVRLSFSEDGLEATAGCNFLGFAYEIEGGHLSGTSAFSTAIGCDSEVDIWLQRLIEDGVDIAMEGEVLTLTDDDVTVRLDRWADQVLDDPHIRWGLVDYGRPEPRGGVLAGAFNPPSPSGRTARCCSRAGAATTLGRWRSTRTPAS